MISAIYPALSALRAFGEKLGVTANNIANINTNGFKKSRADLEEASPSGVNVSIQPCGNSGCAFAPRQGHGRTRGILQCICRRRDGQPDHHKAGIHSQSQNDQG